MTGYSGWTDRDWVDLVRKVRAMTYTELSQDRFSEKVREIAFSYMQKGPDGGGNNHGLLGTLIAVCVDEVQAARCEELQT